MTKSRTNTTSSGSQNSQYSNQYGWQQAPINAQTQAVIDAANGPTAVDPSVQHRYASMAEDLERSYSDPFGAGTSPDVREKAQRSGKMKLGAERDKAMRESYYEGQGMKFGQKLAAAGLTQPTLVNTGGSSSGSSSGQQTTTQQQPLINTIASIGGAVVGGL